MRFALLAFVFMTTAAQGQDLLMATTPEPIAAQMQTAGLQAEVGKDPQGDPVITSSAAGANFTVFFYGCTAGANCTSLQLNACFTMNPATSMEVINKWNNDLRYAKAHVDAKMNTCLLQDVNMAAGIAPDTFANILQNWSQILGKFTTTIGY